MLTVQRLKEAIEYRPDTGQFFWKIRAAKNTTIGSEAGTFNNAGYRCIRIDKKRYLASRLAYLYMCHEWPPHQMDHINRVQDDDRWANLRPATASENQANKGAYKRHKRGSLKGAHFYEKTGKWVAWIGKDRKKYHLGYFDTEELAHIAYLAAAQRMHGAFACGDA